MVIGAIIALVIFALVVGVNAYYGGDSVNDASIKASATKITSEASQVSQAQGVHRAFENAYADTVDELVTETHLSSAPTTDFAIDGPADGNTGLITALASANPTITAEVCAEIEGEATGTDVDPAALPATQTANQRYGCFEDATNGITVFHK